MIDCKFTEDFNVAGDLYAVAGWYGCSGLTFDDMSTARACAVALSQVRGVEDITPDEEIKPNKYGVICVSCTPKTATAAALVQAIFRAFIPEA